MDITTELSAVAKRCAMMIVGAAFLPEGERIYNAAFLLSADGDELGRYRKTHLPPLEERFLTAGTDLPGSNPPALLPRPGLEPAAFGIQFLATV